MLVPFLAACPVHSSDTLHVISRAPLKHGEAIGPFVNDVVKMAAEGSSSVDRIAEAREALKSE